MAVQTSPRFDRKYIPEPNSGCWLWLGAICSGNAGYGQVREGGKTDYAHRASYRMHCGEIPAGLDVCHTCDQPSCVNPDHLFTGTRQENMQDAKRKGRLVVPGPEHLRTNRLRHEDKTHCPQGHAYDEANTYLYLSKRGSPTRHCCACRAAAKARFRSKRKQP